MWFRVDVRFGFQASGPLAQDPGARIRQEGRPVQLRGAYDDEHVALNASSTNLGALPKLGFKQVKTRKEPNPKS